MSHPEASTSLRRSKRVHSTPLAPVQPPSSSTTPMTQGQNITPITPEMQDAFDTYKFFRRNHPPGRFSSVLYGSSKARPYRVVPMPDEYYQPFSGQNLHRSRFIGVSSSPWSIFTGIPFAGVRVDMKINESEIGMTSFRTAHARPSPQHQIIFSYLSQSLNFERRPPSYLTAQIYLCKNQLKHLVGDVIPEHFTVLKSPGKLELCSVLPFRFFCISASSDMPDMLKEGVVHALSQIHEKGVCLGNVELANFFVGDNLKIFVCDLTRATSLTPTPEEGIGEARPEDILLEMRKLKFLLDYRDSRSTEYASIVRASNWDRLARAEYLKQHLDETYRPDIPAVAEDEVRTTLMSLYSEDNWFNALEQRPRMYTPPHYDRTTVYLALGRFSRSIGNTIPVAPAHSEPLHTSTPRYDLRKRKHVHETEIDAPPTKRHRRDHSSLPALSVSTIPAPHSTPLAQSSKWKNESPCTDLEPHRYQGIQPSIIENNLNPRFPPVVVKDFGYELWFRKKEGPQVTFKSPTIQTFSFASPPNSVPRVSDCNTSNGKRRFREDDLVLRPSLKRRRLDTDTPQFMQDASDDDAGDSFVPSRMASESRRATHRRRPRPRVRRLSTTISSFLPSSIGNFLYSWFGI